MGLPDVPGRGIGSIDGERVGEGRDGAAGQGGIHPGGGIGRCRPAEAVQSVPERCRKCEECRKAKDQEQHRREGVVPAHHQRREAGQKHGPERPEGTRGAFGQHPRTGQRHRAAQMGREVRRGGFGQDGSLGHQTRQ